jgi:predicted nucleic acid-binding protein
MILGACQAAGVTRLYTEDMGAPRTIDSIELINPFS